MVILINNKLNHSLNKMLNESKAAIVANYEMECSNTTPDMSCCIDTKII